jgi:hypothetical protein
MKWIAVRQRMGTLDRRGFFRGSLAALGGLWMAAKGLGQQSDKQSGEKPGDAPPGSPTDYWASSGKLNESARQEKYTKRYFRDTAPPFQIPPYEGERYKDNVPDTLDIAERAKLGVHAMTAIADPRADYEIFWFTDFSRNPPAMTHDFNDWVQNVEGFEEALPLLRLATGSSLNDQVDPVWMAGILRSIGPDGLIYLPMQDCPWTRIQTPVGYVNPVWLPGGKQTTLADMSVTQVAAVETCERMIGTMTVYYLRDRNPVWKQAIEKMIDRLAACAIEKDDYAYLPAGSIVPGADFGSGPMPTGNMGEEIGGRVIQGLAQYYKVTGYRPARELAGKLSRYLRFHAGYYELDGTPLVGEDEHHWFQPYGIGDTRHGGHGHSHGIGLLSLLEYGAAVDDKETLAFVQSGFEWIKANNSPLVGFFAEIMMPGYLRSETCFNADMVAMALKLTDAGVADYWDDADRWARNHFLEAQLVDPSWIAKATAQLPPKPVLVNETSDHVAERNVGAFAGWSTGNGWVTGIMHCCTPQASRAMYYLWEHILGFRDGTLRVNLLLNRASEWCDVYSYIPYEGRVELKIKKYCGQTLVRMPEWVAAKSPQVVCEVGGRPRSITWQGRYIALGQALPGERIAVRFPISERTVRETIGGVSYKLEIRGNTVVTIDPRGQKGPLYERAHFRGPVQWREVDRFVPQRTIAW